MRGVKLVKLQNISGTSKLNITSEDIEKPLIED